MNAAFRRMGTFMHATATATPSSPSLPPPPPIKLIPSPKLKKRSQWSAGDAPGEYGGPPLVTQLRKPRGRNEADPFTSSAHYIWNTKWQPYMDRPASEAQSPNPQITDSNTGFLSLNRAIALDSMDVDLSQELMKPSKATLQHQVEAAGKATMQLRDENNVNLEKPRWRFAPTRREEAQWEHAWKATSGGKDTLLDVRDRGGEDSIQQRQEYMKLKSNLQLLTLAVGVVGATSALIIYTSDTAASYGVGLIGAVAYVRMLGNSVDAFGMRDVGGALRGAAGQPRLLVPIVLAMIYNRWNEILVPEYGVVHLQLIPMLVGFFTYKLATILVFVRDIIPSTKYENES